MVPSAATDPRNNASEIRATLLVCGVVCRMLQGTETEIYTGGHDIS